MVEDSQKLEDVGVRMLLRIRTINHGVMVLGLGFIMKYRGLVVDR